MRGRVSVLLLMLGACGSVPEVVFDAAPPDADNSDARVYTLTCGVCTSVDQCAPGSTCVAPSGGGMLCLQLCPSGAWQCPGGFDCQLINSVATCVPPAAGCCVDEDEDEYGQGVACLGADCDDSDNTVNPGADDVCNGEDDDCNPLTLDGSGDTLVGVACDSADTDLCPDDLAECIDAEVICSDVGGNKIDACNQDTSDDCDDTTADGWNDVLAGIPCDLPVEQGGDVDLCQEGALTCTLSGMVCNDYSGTDPYDVEVCDGLNNDCNPGTLDGEQDMMVGLPCVGSTLDQCANDFTVCESGVITCPNSTPDTPDLCDGIDNDCEPLTPDGFHDPTIGISCNGNGCATAEGACVTNHCEIGGRDCDSCTDDRSTCEGGAWTCNNNGASWAEICNDIDDDCDGLTDEDDITIMCPATANVAFVECLGAAGGCHICNASDPECGEDNPPADGCVPGRDDTDGNYANGCECLEAPASNVCSAPLNLGSISAGSVATANAAVATVTAPGELTSLVNQVSGTDSVYYVVTVTPAGDGARGGAPGRTVTIDFVQLYTPADFTYRMDVSTSNCTITAPSCGEETGSSATYITSWSMNDSMATPAGSCGPTRTECDTNLYDLPGGQSITWPSPIYIRVYRADGMPAGCRDFKLRVRRL